MQSRLELWLLGAVQMRFEGQFVQHELPAKALALLCYLATVDAVQSRQTLAGLFWGNAPEQKALGSLRVALNALRKTLPGVLDTTHLTVGLSPHTQCWLDTTVCASLLQTEDPLALRGALDLHRGDFMAGAFIDDAPGFDEWLLVQRAHWQQRMLGGLLRLSDHFLTVRDYRSAVECLQRHLSIEPWSEETHRQLMLAYCRLGDLNAGLAQYETCRRLLREELAVEPMPETEALAHRMQAARASRPPTFPNDGAPFVGREAELAHLRLLLTNPQCRLITIFGVGGIGKSRLAMEAAQQAAREEALTYLNGVVFVSLAALTDGSTALFAIAQSVALPLGAQTQPDQALLNFLMNKEMLFVLDGVEHLLFDSERPDHAGTILTLIEQILAQCPLVKLLVTSRVALNLDAEWRLHLDGLAIPPVQGPPQAADELTEYGAVQLFLHVARQAQPDFRLLPGEREPLRHLCQLVGGMPLALKLAAAWVRVMDISQMVTEVEQGMDLLSTRLHDTPPRQRSIRAIFEQTWAQLAPPEQRALRWLSRFRGGFTADAAHQVADATSFTLAALMDRGLIFVRKGKGDARYECHELTRQFATEQLVAAGELVPASQRHARFFQRYAESVEQALILRTWSDEVDKLPLERDNFFAALTWLALPENAPAETETGSRLIAALWAAWLWRASWLEGRRWLQRMSSLPPPTQPTVGRMRLIHCLGIAAQIERQSTQARAILEEHIAQEETMEDALGLAAMQLSLAVVFRDLGNYAAAKAHLAESLPLWERTQSRWGCYLVSIQFGQISIRQGAYADAARFFAQSLSDARTLSDGWYGVYALHNLLLLALVQGERATARRYYDEILHLSRALPARTPQLHALAGIVLDAYALGNVVAWSAYFMDDYATATLLFEEQLVEAETRGDQLLKAWLLNHLGDVVRSEGGRARARRLYAQSLALFSGLDNRSSAALVLHNLGYIALHDDDAAQAAQLFAEALEHYQDAGLAWNIAGCLIGLAGVAHDVGDRDGAAILLGAAYALRARVDVSGAYESPMIRRETEQISTAVQAALGDERWKRCLEQGQQLSEPDAIALGLQLASTQSPPLARQLVHD